MDREQLSIWLRIVEVKAAVLSIAFCVNEDEMYTLEDAKKGLVEIADSLDVLEQLHLEGVRQFEVEASLLLEKQVAQAAVTA